MYGADSGVLFIKVDDDADLLVFGDWRGFASGSTAVVVVRPSSLIQGHST